MIIIVLLLIAFYWLLIGKERSFFLKVITTMGIIGAVVLFLRMQGSTYEQVLEILFSF